MPRIALLHYQDGEALHRARNLEVGTMVMSGQDLTPKPGNAMALADIPVGLAVHNIELVPGRGARWFDPQVAVLSCSPREGKIATLALPSGEIRQVNSQCRATVVSSAMRITA